MTEQEYITATNLAKARIALSTLHDIMVGDEYGVDQKTYREAYKALEKLVDDLYTKLEIKE